MTPTERLRELLDERGVEWKDSEPYGAKAVTRFKVNGVWLRYVDYGDYCWMDYHEDEPLTPEQVIAATLGQEPDDAAMVKLHDRMNAALHKYERAQGIEMRDGDGEVIVPFVFDMHSLLEEAATLGAGTCRIYDCEGSFSAVNRPVWRCDCGAFMTQYTDATTYHKPRFCPNCGRRVVSE